jgi:hypothetical protein
VRIKANKDPLVPAFHRASHFFVMVSKSTIAASLLSVAASSMASSVWTVNCDPLTVQRSDPIVSPGVVSSHVHSVVGGTAFRRNMSGINDATNAKATTCDKYTDHSNYWCPQLYEQNANSTFTLVPFLGAVSLSTF